MTLHIWIHIQCILQSEKYPLERLFEECDSTIYSTFYLLSSYSTNSIWSCSIYLILRSVRFLVGAQMSDGDSPVIKEIRIDTKPPMVHSSYSRDIGFLELVLTQQSMNAQLFVAQTTESERTMKRFLAYYTVYETILRKAHIYMSANRWIKCMTQ